MGGEDSMMKKVLVAATAGALALGGLAAMGVGGAGAAKPQLSGTLHCNTSGVTTFSPPGVLSLSQPQVKKGKDKKVKVTTVTNYTGCTGSEPSSGLPVPTSATVNSKSKNPSRLCTSFTSLPPGKTKYVFGGVHKSKPGAQGTTTTKADNGTFANLADDLLIPASTAPTFNAFLVAHGNDGTVSTSNGSTLAGKAYAAKSIQTISHSGSLIQKVVACSGPVGLATVVTSGPVGIGVPA
jgi:hypothetical protein